VSQEELRKRVDLFLATITGGGEGDNELGKLLLDILKYRKGMDKLIIVPHGVLHYLPFQALKTSAGRFLIEELELRYLPSGSVLRVSGDKVKRDSQGIVVAVGNPDHHDPRAALAYAEVEVQDLGMLFPDSRVLIREQATRANLMPLVPQARILHFATHAKFNEADPLGTAILLTGDTKGEARIEVQEIYSWNIKAQLVVLSACETGLGTLNRGDELIGFTRAILYAGAPSVITTLWNIDDKVSAMLMKRFYQSLKDGLNKAQALRHAQLQTMHLHRAPFFWAAYQLTGEAF